MPIAWGNRVWPEDYYPGIHSKIVEEFASDFELYRDFDKLNSIRKRGLRLRDLNRSSSSSSCGLIKPDSFVYEYPVYPDDVSTRFQPLDISIGKPLDLISLLLPNTAHNHSKTLVRFPCATRSEYVNDIQSCFKGKHVLVLCLFVPVDLHDAIGRRVLEYSLFVEELLSSYPDKFEAVLVVKMKPKWANDEAVFTNFLSAFPSSCLVVPFGDTARIDAICRSLNLQGSQKGVLVDPRGIVVQDSMKFVGDIHFMESFPSTERYNPLRPSESWLHKPLVQLLGCGGLTRCNSGDGSSVSISVSELANNKVVGLYLCGTGYDIPLLHRLYNECRAQHLDFEVVLVYVHSISGYSPKVIQDVIAPFLHENNIPFWVLPFNYTVSLRLYDLADCRLSDKLLIVSYGKLKEIDGELFLYSLGSSAYPFDRESLIHRALGEIQKLTLESLLELGSLRHGNKPSDEVSVTCLKGKNVILFLGTATAGKYLYQLIEKHYDEIKGKNAGFEVVFAYLNDAVPPPMVERISSKPWLVFHPDCSRPQSVIQALSLWGVKPHFPSLIAFGVDGRISSLDAEHALKLHGSDAFPFSADLHKEIATKLNEHLFAFRNRIGPYRWYYSV